jgi:hypothetical protein
MVGFLFLGGEMAKEETSKRTTGGKTRIEEKQMKKLRMLGLICAVIATVIVGSSVMAASKSITGNVNLVQKNYADWSIVPGAWGRFNYKFDGTNISGVFNGKKLAVGATYSLVAYTESWPNDVVLGTGTVNGGGEVNIGVAPIALGAPYVYSTGEYAGQSGYKIWLIPGDGTLTWPPSPDWLWETSLVPAL